MRYQDTLENDWAYVLSLLPGGMGEEALKKLAIVRRREIRTAGDLLRLCLAYGLCDMSLRQVAVWAEAIGLGHLSNVAVLKRLRRCGDWLGQIIGWWFAERGLASNVPPWSVRLVDASSIRRPGQSGTDYRVHLGWDLAEQRITEVEVTDRAGGETLTRHRVPPGAILVADAGYAQREGLGAVRRRGGHVLLRGHWKNVPLETEGGRRAEVLALLETLRPNEVGDWRLYVRAGAQRFPMRLIAVTKSTAATERSCRRIRRAAQKSGARVDPRSCRAAAYMTVLTDLPADRLPAVQALELYRLRWQIELAFKRLKSLLALDHLRARTPELTRVYLLAKMLGALIVEELSHRALSVSPWGYRLPPAALEPLAALRAGGGEAQSSR